MRGPASQVLVMGYAGCATSPVKRRMHGVHSGALFIGGSLPSLHITACQCKKCCSLMKAWLHGSQARSEGDGCDGGDHIGGHGWQ